MTTKSENQLTEHDCRDIESSPYCDPCETGRDEFTASELRDRIQKQLGVDHEAIEGARMQSILDADHEPRYSLRDEGRNPDGSGESYAERNA